MNINLRKFKFFPSLSEETNAFTSDIYVDNIKVAEAKDAGRGGEIEIRPYADKNELLKKMREYCASLPALTSAEHGGYELKMDLELLIGQLVLKEIETAELKKVEKKFINSFIFGNKNKKGTYFQIRYSTPLANFPADKLKATLERELKEVQKKYPHFVLWNNNLSELIPPQ